MKWMLGLCVGLAATGQAAAQARVDEPDVVLVTGLRIETERDAASVDASIFTQTDIAQRSLSQAADVLSLAPGVTVTQAGGFGGVTYARIRGSSSSHTLVLIDGVPVNDVSAPGGGFDFGSLDLFDVGRLEIIRGPQSTEWGSDALAGVIALQTAAPSAPFEVRGLAEAGSFSSLRVGASLAGKGDHASGRVSGLWRSADGISKADERNGNTEADGYDTANLSASGDVRLSGSWSVSGVVRWAKGEVEFDGFPPPTFGLADTNERTESEELSGAVTLTGDSLDGRLHNKLQLAHSDIDRTNLDGSITTSSNQGRRDLYRYTGRIDGPRSWNIAFGGEHEDAEADGENASSNAVFGLFQWSPIQPLTLSGGLRHDDSDRHDGKTTGNVGIAWRATDNLIVRANWAQGFRAPSIFQTTFVCGFCGATTPNRDLKPETSEGADLGLEWRRGGLAASIVAFTQDTDNLIDFDFSRGYANIAKAKQDGVEFDLAAPLVGWLSSHLAYTYVDARDGSGARLLRVPRESGVVELLLDPPGGFDAVATVRFNGDQPDVDADDFSPTLLPSWTRTDLSVRYVFSAQLEVYARVENVFDEQYQQVDGYGTPGVSGVIGIRVRP